MARTPTSEEGAGWGRAPSRARLFVALDPDEEARSLLATWRDAAFADREDLRLPSAATLHVTLAFLGHRPETEIVEIARLSLSALDGLRAPELAAGEVIGVPRRRPRLFALDLEDPSGRAAAVHGAVVGALEAAGLFARERRPFWPHLTVARVRSRAEGPRASVDPPTGGAASTRGPLRFDRVVLYRSHLSPSGARYEALEGRILAS